MEKCTLHVTDILAVIIHGNCCCWGDQLVSWHGWEYPHIELNRNKCLSWPVTKNVVQQRWPECPWESYLNVHKCGILLQNLTVCICFLSICSAQVQESAISKNVTKNFSKPNTNINPPHFLCLWFAHWEILSSPLNAPKRNNLSF
jgi:hypothetical protein